MDQVSPQSPTGKRQLISLFPAIQLNFSSTSQVVCLLKIAEAG